MKFKRSGLLALFVVAGFLFDSHLGRVGAQPFVHPGTQHAEAVYDRVRAKVQAGQYPWIDNWNILIELRYATR